MSLVFLLCMMYLCDVLLPSPPPPGSLLPPRELPSHLKCPWSLWMTEIVFGYFSTSALLCLPKCSPVLSIFLQTTGFWLFFLTNKFEALMKGWKGLHVGFRLFVFVYHILRDFKESEVGNCRPPPETTPCHADALPLAFLKWEWFMSNHASGLLAFLCSLVNRACMNKLCYQESLTYFWIRTTVSQTELWLPLSVWTAVCLQVTEPCYNLTVFYFIAAV